MNKVINDLCEHADFYVGNEHYDKSHEEKQRLFMEKFASLIIEQCTHLIRIRKEVAIDDGWNVDEAMTIVETEIEDWFDPERTQ